MFIDIDIIKDIAQTLFYITMIILGVFSYIQAKKTLFAPIKTETFKLQLKAIQQVLNQFSNRKETSIIDNFDIHNVFTLNFNILIQNYLKTFFPDFKVNEEFSEELKQQVAGAYALTNELPDDAKEGHYLNVTTYDNELVPEDPALKLSKWQNYIYSLVLYTEEYSNKIDSLTQLQTTPVLPLELREMIKTFIESLENNVGLMRETLTKISKELPKLISTIDEGKIPTDWAWNIYRDSWNELEAQSIAINDWVNHYLKVNILTVDS